MKKGIRGLCAATTMAAMMFSVVSIATPVAHAGTDWTKIAGGVLGVILDGGSRSNGNSTSNGGALLGDLSNQKHARPNPTREEKLFLLAVESNDYETAQSMLDAGVDVNLVSERGTALYIAMYEGNREMMQFLLEHGADVNGYYKLNGKYVCYIVEAAAGGLRHYGTDVELIKYLHEWGADINGIGDGRYGRNNALNVIIGRAAENMYHYDGDIECARYLAENGINLENRQWANGMSSIRGRTPFIGAVAMGWYSMANLLANYGADINARDGSGKTALDIALEKGNMQYYKQIQDIMARGQQPAKWREVEAAAQAKKAKNKEIAAYIKPISNGVKEWDTATLKLTEILKDRENMSSKDRAKKVKKLLPPLEKSLKSLNEDKTSLSNCTAEEKEMLKTWKNSITSALAKEIERIRFFTVERDLTTEEIQQVADASEELVALANEAEKNRTRFNEYIKANG